MPRRGVPAVAPVVAAPAITPGVVASRLFGGVFELHLQSTFLNFPTSIIPQVDLSRRGGATERRPARRDHGARPRPIQRCARGRAASAGPRRQPAGRRSPWLRPGPRRSRPPRPGGAVGWMGRGGRRARPRLPVSIHGARILARGGDETGRAGAAGRRGSDGGPVTKRLRSGRRCGGRTHLGTGWGSTGRRKRGTWAAAEGRPHNVLRLRSRPPMKQCPRPPRPRPRPPL